MAVIDGVGQDRRLAASHEVAGGGEQWSGDDVLQCAVAAPDPPCSDSNPEDARAAAPTPFQDLFVLEMANNHWGNLGRGLRIIDAFGEVVGRNGVRAAIKLQFRDVESFIHKDHLDRPDHRYIRKLAATRLTWDQLRALVEATRAAGMVTMATPFDAPSVERCVEFDVEILKIASSDIRDWRLIGAMAATGKPVIASTGGGALADIDALVEFFAGREIPFALNHCVSIYPSEDHELELNQIDFLRARYPGLVIGFSTHERHDWKSSLMLAYAKGARTFERHIDIAEGGIAVAPYCTLPDQADEWFKAFHKAREMCGAPANAKRAPPEKEVRYLDELVRGVFARHPLRAGHALTAEDVYFAVPLMRGQISVREFTGGEVLRRALQPDEAVALRDADSHYADDIVLRHLIEDRGVEPLSEQPPPARRMAAGR